MVQPNPSRVLALAAILVLSISCGSPEPIAVPPLSTDLESAAASPYPDTKCDGVVSARGVYLVITKATWKEATDWSTPSQFRGTTILEKTDALKGLIFFDETIRASYRKAGTNLVYTIRNPIGEMKQGMPFETRAGVLGNPKYDTCESGILIECWGSDHYGIFEVTVEVTNSLVGEPVILTTCFELIEDIE